MTTSKSWLCEGKPKDGKDYPNAFAHQPYENFGPDCAICGLPREAIETKGKRPAAGAAPNPSGNRTGVGLAAGLITALLLALLGAGAWFVWKQLQGKSPSPIATNSPSPNSPAPPLTAAPTDRFSSGERTLFTYRGNFDRDRGIAAFAQGDYAQAITAFEKATRSSPNDPEPQLYANNARARQTGNPLTIAVVVPIDNQATSAEEILRGVADAQTQFNTAGGASQRLLEVMLVNDSNDPVQAAAVAQQLASDPNILGVIGHNSSDTTAKALPIYESAGLAMISPTSTSTVLSGKTFFRTVPSDQLAGETLADYVSNRLNIKQVAVFYDSASNYSNSIQQAFTGKFTQLGGQVPQPPIDLSSPSLDIKNSVTGAAGTVRAALLFPSTKTTSVAIAVARENAQLPAAQQMQLLGGDALYNPATLTDGGDAVKGLVLTVPWYPQNAYAQTAAQRWLGQVSWRTASSFDAAKALTAALATAIDRPAVLQALRSLNLPADQTAGEPLQFTPTGDRTEKPILVEAASGSAAPQGAKFGFQVVQ
ncbi:MAG: ABC transporter substrate-binding protein [Drouetiella hepatica Uher 2000/2452]|uniref:ABC transporter substrate-binding protein n=1 Tax=Drouetiella hepatica Uher 2000/2452 TaxID=904376 RepID=A0A951QGG7_9CYAN|nr:ABC transporter substrate-binding protein [Drouetiella hepatica Uher 2000/2452]